MPVNSCLPVVAPLDSFKDKGKGSKDRTVNPGLVSLDPGPHDDPSLDPGKGKCKGGSHLKGKSKA